MPKTPPDFGTQNPRAKSTKADGISDGIAVITRLIRKHGWTYEQWRYVAKRVRERTDLKPERAKKHLPRVLTSHEFQKFYATIDKTEDPQHALMLRLLFFTGARVSELCRIEVKDVDLETYKIRIEQGKGGKDRYVLFGRSFATALRTHLLANSKNRYVFQTQRNSKFTARRVQQIVKFYAEKAGVQATPHTFRHQMITWLSRHGDLADAELQLLTGHARRETLAVYQHVALDTDLEATMKRLDL
jgi:integrase/recombinase XerD